jgi:GGDEF domain-containing protein
MFDAKAITVLLITLALALVGITKPDVFSPQVNDILAKPVSVSLSTLAGALLGYAAIMLYIATIFVSRTKKADALRDEETRLRTKKADALRDEETRVKSQEIELLKGQIRDRDRLRLLDRVTGIPNQIKWDQDIEAIGQEDDPDPHYQMILIDLDNFREINARYGYERGDHVIKEFARQTFESMRRNEQIYKKFTREQSKAGLKSEVATERIYRKYSGGDEFILLIHGTQPEALGFINRVFRDLLPKVNDRISKFILDEKMGLTFHAGVSEWQIGDTPQDSLRKMEATLRGAVNSAVSRICWDPATTADEYERKEKARTGVVPRYNPYRDAQQIFKKNSTSTS